MLSHFSQDILEKEKLLEFNTAEGQQGTKERVDVTLNLISLRFQICTTT